MKKLFQLRFVLAALLIITFITIGTNTQRAAAAGQGPCDIYAAGGTPCVAAHSTVRALFGAYSGRLYQVRRASNNQTTDIGTLSAGGFANAAAQDSFCSGTSCVITIIYDQTTRGNHLLYQGPGGAGGQDTPANATSESITVSGNKAYALFINPGNSYWRNGSSTGIPTGSAPEGMYMVTSGTHVNSGCCFDYGNSETTRTAAGAGHMDAINFSTSCWFGGCVGTGPWVQADLEFGLFSGGSTTWNTNQRAFTNRFVTATLKNNGTTAFAIKGANAQSGSLTTLWNGALPSGYNPMRKEGAIILGSGGDCCATNTNQSIGTFYEGAMVSGYPSDATENAVQANVVAAAYNTTSVTYFRITNRNSGKVMDVQAPNTTAGSKIGQFAANGQPWQDWQFVDVGSGYFNIKSRNSGMCLDVNGASSADGASIIQWTCNGQNNQQFQWRASGSFFQIVARHSSKCVDVVGASTANLALLEQRTCGTANNFLWSR